MNYPRLNPTQTHTQTGGPILYLDLDTVIVGDLSPLLDFFVSPPSATSVPPAPTLAALGTEALRSEGGRPHGLNTSVLLWRAHDPRWAPLFTDLWGQVLEVVRKLDWWVEMVAAKKGKGSVLQIQDRWPGLVVDFQALNDSPGEGAAVVVFPLRPKPADVVGTVPWVREHWR